MEEWRRKAEEYFFQSHLTYSEIAALLGISRQSVASWLKSQPEHEQEIKRRRQQTHAARKEYKRKKQAEYRRSVPMTVTAETMRREHDLAALELSREVYH